MPLGYVMLNSSRKSREFFSMSCSAMPRKTMFLSLTFCQAISRSFASARQGGHQEAQKFKKTALPRSSSSVSLRPSNRVTVNGGAGFATKGDLIYRASLLKPKASSQRNGAMIRTVSTRRRQAILHFLGGYLS